MQNTVTPIHNFNECLIVQALKQLGLSLSDAQHAEIFEAIDTDGDGNITLDEFTQFLVYDEDLAFPGDEEVRGF